MLFQTISFYCKSPLALFISTVISTIFPTLCLLSWSGSFVKLINICLCKPGWHSWTHFQVWTWVCRKQFKFNKAWCMRAWQNISRDCDRNKPQWQLCYDCCYVTYLDWDLQPPARESSTLTLQLCGAADDAALPDTSVTRLKNLRFWLSSDGYLQQNKTTPPTSITLMDLIISFSMLVPCPVSVE